MFDVSATRQTIQVNCLGQAGEGGRRSSVPCETHCHLGALAQDLDEKFLTAASNNFEAAVQQLLLTARRNPMHMAPP